MSQKSRTSNLSENGHTVTPISFSQLQIQQQAPQQFTCSRGSVLAKEGPVVQLLEGIFAANNMLLIGGPKQAMKTSVAVELAMSIATATPALGGYFKWNGGKKRRVMLGSFETTGCTLDNLLKRILMARGFKAKGADSVIEQGVRILNENPDLSSIGNIDNLLDLCVEEKCGGLLLDPFLGMTHGIKLENQGQVSNLLGHLEREARRRKITIIACTHNRSAENKPVKDDAWRTPSIFHTQYPAISNLVRQSLAVEPRANYDAEMGRSLIRMVASNQVNMTGGDWQIEFIKGHDDEFRWDVRVQKTKAAAKNSERKQHNEDDEELFKLLSTSTTGMAYSQVTRSKKNQAALLRLIEQKRAFLSEIPGRGQRVHALTDTPS